MVLRHPGRRLRVRLSLFAYPLRLSPHPRRHRLSGTSGRRREAPFFSGAFLRLWPLAGLFGSRCPPHLQRKNFWTNDDESLCLRRFRRSFARLGRFNDGLVSTASAPFFTTQGRRDGSSGVLEDVPFRGSLLRLGGVSLQRAGIDQSAFLYLLPKTVSARRDPDDGLFPRHEHALSDIRRFGGLCQKPAAFRRLDGGRQETDGPPDSGKRSLFHFPGRSAIVTS